MENHVKGEGEITLTLPAASAARWMCLSTHPIAIALGTAKPDEPCCSACAYVSVT